MSHIVKAFNKYVVEIEGEIEVFATHNEAAIAVEAYQSKESFEASAQAYTDAKGLDGKNAMGKRNIIMDYLAWAATSPEKEVPLAAVEDIVKVAPVEEEEKISAAGVPW